MSKFVKPNNDRIFYLFSNQATQTTVGSKTVEYRWDIADITLDDFGKLTLIDRTYKTLDVANTNPLITRILNISSKDSIDTSRRFGAILDCSYWKDTVNNNNPTIIVSPQTINNITLSISDDIVANAGITTTNVFCIMLKLTEGDREVVQFGSTNDVNITQRQINYKS